jgi:small-conductance mechanosensitive channel
MEQIIRWLNQILDIVKADTLPGMILKAVLATGLALLAWLVINTVLRIVKKRLSAVTVIQINEQLFAMVRRTVGLGLVLFLGTYLIRLFGLQLLEKPLQAIFILLFAAPIKQFLLVLLSYLEQNWAQKTETKIDNIIFELLNRFSGALLYSVAVVLALDIMGINVMPFVAGAGVLGVAVGFAAKDTLSNLIAGVLLIIDRPFEIGDRIEVWSAPANSATWGDVIDIGLRATKIKTTDNIIIVIPNNEIMKRDIVNYTLISTNIRVRINIGVAYDTNIDQAKKAIIDVASELDWVLKTPAPRVVVRNFGESSIDLQLRVWIEDARRRIHTISAVTDNVKAAFDRQGIEIPFPKRDVHIIKTA